MNAIEKVLYTAKTHTTGGRDGASRSSAAGRERASGAPCPAHCGPYPNYPAAFAAACSTFPAS